MKRLALLLLLLASSLRAQGAPTLPFGPGYQTLPPLFATTLVDGYWYKKTSGIIGDGTDDGPAIQAAENATPVGGTVKFTPGRTYTVNTAGNVAGVLKVTNSHIWDLTGATIKYGSSASLTTGSDGAAIPVVAVLSTPFRVVAGTFDGNAKAAHLIGFQGNLTGGVQLQFVTLQNSNENFSAWNHLAYTVSVDVSGIAVNANRAQNVSGLIILPNEGVVNASNVIVAHQNVTAELIGGSATWGNATGNAFVNAGGSQSTVFELTNGNIQGVPQFITNSGTIIQNSSLQDFAAYDIGSRHQEHYGAILNIPMRQTFSSGGAYTPGWCNNDGTVESYTHIITVSANVAVTVANLTNNCALSVDRTGMVYFTIRNTSGGALTTGVTFNGTIYRMSATVSPGNGQNITVGCMFDQVNNECVEVFRGVAVGN